VFVGIVIRDRALPALGGAMLAAVYLVLVVIAFQLGDR
jgi:hypothetical protein